MSNDDGASLLAPKTAFPDVSEEETAASLEFQVGQSVRTLRHSMTIRASEEIDSEEVCYLAEGNVLTVVEHGEQAGGWLRVRTTHGTVGWISCQSKAGAQLIEIVKEDAAAPAQQAPVTEASQATATLAFPIGECVRTLRAAMPMRAGEELDSQEVCRLAEGKVLMVVEHGAQTGRRLRVRVADDAETVGWISCQSKAGARLVEIVEEDVARDPARHLATMKAGGVPDAYLDTLLDDNYMHTLIRHTEDVAARRRGTAARTQRRRVWVLVLFAAGAVALVFYKLHLRQALS